jgi:uncharacterized repeat protein (TIGR02059 family)
VNTVINRFLSTKFVRVKNALFLILLFISYSATATTYYIDPSGSDSYNGTINSPWKTLAYACSRVRTSGDIIHVNAGTYVESDQSVLAVGVSIEGVGASSVILSQVTSTFTITLTSSVEGTNGNQHISGINMDGDNMTARQAIVVNARSNVEIYNCTFEDFFVMGVVFNGGVGYLNGAPSVFATGNSFHDNIMNNCSGYFIADDNGWGNLNIGAQEGMLVYNNTIVQNQRGSGANGYCIKFYSYGYNKGLKIYNNTLTADEVPAYPYWSFAIESWNSLGGLEIYDNIIEGCIDLVKANLGDYSKAADIHDNTIGFDVVNTPLDGEGELGIHVEDRTTDLYIHHNHFRNLAVPIYFSTSSDRTMQNVYIYYNVFSNVGTTINSKGLGIRITSTDYSNIFDNWNINNNVFSSNQRAGATLFGIQIPAGITSNITVNNNIIKGFSISPIQKNNDGTYNNISIENNLFYGNGNNNEPSGSATYADYTIQNNIKSDPLFVSSTDFHLQAGSPAIGKGLYHSWMTTDYVGVAVKDPPSIGAYEYYLPGLPVYQSSVIENATPALLDLTYDLILANIIPSSTAFTVLVNYVRRTVNSVTITGNKVRLTLSTPVIYGDVVSVSYTSPSSNPLQTALGGLAGNLVSKPVTNNCISIIPVYTSSAIENATPTLLDITYSMSLANIVPAVSAFKVQVNSVDRTISSISISGNKVRLTLASAVNFGEIITVSYTPPASNPIQSTTGGLAATLVNRSVSNNLLSVIPVYSSSAIENATPTLLEITYSMSLANILPAISAFKVQVKSIDRTISSISISGNKVRLTLASAVNYGDIITVSYTPPASNRIQSTTGGLAAALVNRSVSNNLLPVIPVYTAATVENATPSVIELTYDIALASVIPSVTSFNVQVNSAARTVNSVTVSGNKVLLNLPSPVVFGNVVIVSYTRPLTNPLQSVSGGIAANLVSKSVTNNCKQIVAVNTPPIVVVKSPATIYAGFVSEIDATASYDPNNDPLIIDWIVPSNVPVSSVKSLKTQFLAPVNSGTNTVSFQLKVSDGVTLQTKIITINILPYKPELSVAKVTHIEASGFQLPDSPSNIVDGNIATYWSCDGDNQFITLSLDKPYKISHLDLAFIKGQQFESYFDIFGSKDNIVWESILTKATSCNFTGDRQVFDFPATKSNTEYSYVKYVGHGNSLNTMNKVSEFRIFGTGQSGSNSETVEKNKVTLYPNPTNDQLNISIGEPTIKPNKISITDNSGTIVFVGKLNPEIKYIQTPINLKSGIYVVSLSTDNTILYAQRLVVIR